MALELASDLSQPEQRTAPLATPEERLRLVLGQMPAVLWTTDEQLHITSALGAGLDAVGLGSSQADGLRLREWLGPDDDKGIILSAHQQALLGESSSYQATVKGRVFQAHVEPLRRGGTVTGCIGIALDVTERHHAEKSARQVQHRYQELIENASDIIYQADADGRFTFCNARTARVIGCSVNDLLGKHYLDLVAPEARRATERFYGRQFVRREPNTYYEFPAQSGSGEKVWLGQNVQLLLDDDRVTGFQAVARDITERKQVEEELRRAKDAAEAISRTKNEFLATVSHEFRTPLNGILGMTTLLKNTELTRQQREYLDLVQTSADTLLVLINDLLDFAKIEAGKLELVPRAFDLRDLLDAQLKVLFVRASQKELTMSRRIASGVPRTVVGDRDRLNQVLLNLMSNAVKFTERGKVEVRVALEETAGDRLLLHFAVSDTGIGIPADKRHMVFAPFTQADSMTTRKYGGTGLGLTIATRLVGLMGGRIWVESEVGKGSVFHFTARFALPEPTSRTVPALSSRASLPRPVRPLDILLAEDNVINQKVAVGLLGQVGHRVSVVGNGRDALQLLERQRFDLVLMDLHMPELGGLEAVACLREREQRTGGRVPVIALTAQAMEGDRARCRAAGCDGYVSKPFHVDDLFQEIDAVLAPDAPAGVIVCTSAAGKQHDSATVLDRPRFLASCQGGAANVRQFVGMFREHAAKWLAEVDAAVAGRDGEKVRSVAHSLRGAAAQFGGTATAAAARRLETLGREKQWQDVDGAAAALRQQLEHFLAALAALERELMP